MYTFKPDLIILFTTEKVTAKAALAKISLMSLNLRSAGIAGMKQAEECFVLP